MVLIYKQYLERKTIEKTNEVFETQNVNQN